MALDTQIRHGAGNLYVKDYGADDETYDQVDVDQSEDGMEFNFSGETKEIKSAQHTAPYKRLLVGESASLKIGVLERDMDLIARAFAHKPADVVDDAISSPKKKTLEFGGPRILKKLTIKVVCPQALSESLNDTLILYRVVAKPEYSEVYKIGQERVIPVIFVALADVEGTEGAAAGALGSIASEVAA